MNAAVQTPCAGVVRGGKILALKTATRERAFAQEGVGLVEGALKESGAGLDTMAGGIFVIGPGSFTGIRIGLSLLKGMFFRHPFPVVPLSSLNLLAHPFFGRGPSLCAVLDAKMGQIYGAWYGPAGEERIAPCAEAPEKFAGRLSGEVLL